MVWAKVISLSDDNRVEFYLQSLAGLSFQSSLGMFYIDLNAFSLFTAL